MSRWTRRVVWGGLVVALVALSGRAGEAHAEPSVLFDEGHGERFLIEKQGTLDLSGLADVFRAQGVRVQSSGEGLTDARLSAVDAVVISGAFASFTSAEIDATSRFLKGGGRLSVMLHIPQPVAPLLRLLGVDFSNGVIRERENVIGDDPLNFHVTALRPHPLTRRIEAFDAFGAWALLSQSANATMIAQTSPRAWIDLNGNGRLDQHDAVQSFGIVVAGQLGLGRFVVFGDDAIFQNRFLVGGNATLANNLACWLSKVECG